MATIARRMDEEEEEQTPNKKTKITQQQSQQQEDDRISQLPDDILHPILSLLTLKEACITTALSKRWRNLFPSLPRLDFDGFSFDYSSVREHAAWDQVHEIDIDRWMESFCNILESRRVPVRICTIRSSYFHLFSEDFGNIIRFLCNEGIQELDIYNSGKRYTVPSCIYFCQTLTSIVLCKCILKVPSKFTGLRRLKAIKLEECMAEEGDMERLILSCRDVERLTAEDCYGFRNLAVDSDKLTVLNASTKKPLTLSISNAPRLESVTVGFRDPCYSSDSSDSDDGSGPDDEGSDANDSVVISSDSDDGSGPDNEGGEANDSAVSRLLRLLESLGNVKHLSLEFQSVYLKFMKLEGVGVPPSLPSLLPNMKRLTLKMQPDIACMASIVSCLLNSCPNLEDLVMGDNRGYSTYPVVDYWDTQMPCNCMRNTLSTVTVYLNDGWYWKYWIKLVRFLLNNACVLKKLVIDCHRSMRSILEDVQMKLLLLQPASPDVAVELKIDRRGMFHLI